jgi:hypothetical protein
LTAAETERRSHYERDMATTISPASGNKMPARM